MKNQTDSMTATTLPALRHLGDLADARPCILVDTREQAAILIERWAWFAAREIVTNANTLLRGHQQTQQKEKIT